jgi:hypothetical protein
MSEGRMKKPEKPEKPKSKKVYISGTASGSSSDNVGPKEKTNA